MPLDNFDNCVLGNVVQLKWEHSPSPPEKVSGKVFLSLIFCPGGLSDFHYFSLESLGSMFLVPSLNLGFCAGIGVGSLWHS